jgi:hypothetical protein
MLSPVSLNSVLARCAGEEAQTSRAPAMVILLSVQGMSMGKPCQLLVLALSLSRDTHPPEVLDSWTLAINKAPSQSPFLSLQFFSNHRRVAARIPRVLTAYPLFSTTHSISAQEVHSPAPVSSCRITVFQCKV